MICKLLRNVILFNIHDAVGLLVDHMDQHVRHSKIHLPLLVYVELQERRKERVYHYGNVELGFDLKGDFTTFQHVFI